ncbi:hypothetical protein NMG60_11028144 [Bertholletia excelsa]
MGKAFAVLLLFSAVMVTTVPAVHAASEGPKEVEKWFKKLGRAKETLTKLHFYFHDLVAGKNITSVTVAKPNTTDRFPTMFGQLNVMDNPLTVGPELNSGTIGRAQGIFGSAGLEEPSLLMTMNLVFTEGKHKGSTLALLGRNVIFHQYREMSIVGGTGVFRLARGIATAKTYSYSPNSNGAVVEYHVIALHYN